MLDQDITEQPRGAVNAPDDIDHGDDDDVAPPNAPAAANFPASHLAQDLKRPRQEGDGAPSDRGGRGLALPRGLPDAQYAALSLDRLSVQLGNLAVQVTNLPSQVARAIPAALRAHEEADRARYASMRESQSLEARAFAAHLAISSTWRTWNCVSAIVTSLSSACAVILTLSDRKASSGWTRTSLISGQQSQLTWRRLCTHAP